MTDAVTGANGSVAGGGAVNGAVDGSAGGAARSPVVPEVLTGYAHKARKVAWVSAALIFVVFAAVAFTLRGNTESGKSVFHIEDQVAMTLLGLLAAIGVMWFTRPRVIADRDGIRVRNLLGWIELPWDIIVAVRFDRGTPWAMIDLADDDVVAVMAVQAADKDYAITTVRALRAMLAAHRPRPPASDIN